MASNLISEGVRIEIPLQRANLLRLIVVLRPAIEGWVTDVTTGVLFPLVAIEKTLTAIGEDANLSPEGKRNAADAAGRAGFVKLDGFETQTIGGYGKNEAALLAQILKQPAASTDLGDRIISEMQRREVRDELRRYRLDDPLQRNAFYSATDNAFVRSALADAPPTLFRATPDALPVVTSFIDEALVAQQRIAEAEMRDPARARELKDVQLLAAAARAVLATARAAVREAVPSLKNAPDDLAAAAGAAR